jgi:transposase
MIRYSVCPCGERIVSSDRGGAVAKKCVTCRRGRGRQGRPKTPENDWRKAVIEYLRRGGMSGEAVARIFGITKQRIERLAPGMPAAGYPRRRPCEPAWAVRERQRWAAQLVDFAPKGLLRRTFSLGPRPLPIGEPRPRRPTREEEAAGWRHPGLTLREIAQQMECSLGAAGQLLHHARERGLRVAPGRSGPRPKEAGSPAREGGSQSAPDAEETKE